MYILYSAHVVVYLFLFWFMDNLPSQRWPQGVVYCMLHIFLLKYTILYDILNFSIHTFFLIVKFVVLNMSLVLSMVPEH